MGRAMMGTGEASGEKRAIEAAEAAISNPLLDDVSMRGARGLLISITGGPDLTLYEVDEAATRIREEVDPEANIILGATFDESLEGMMRVSVVATGLAAEMLKGGKPAEAPEEIADKPSVFGWTGKQPAAPRPAVQPAPIAVRTAPASLPPAPRPAAEPAPVAEAAPAVVPAAAERLAQPAPRPVRMPPIEEFPPQVQRQIEAQQSRIESIADHAEKKKPGLFQRLASVGLGRKEDAPPPAPAPREPAMTVQPAASAPPATRPAAPAPRPQAAPQQAELNLDDDQLEIPAFLRRQSN
jgi:cell division protein FtsZ